jgi:hypothetical protein
MSNEETAPMTVAQRIAALQKQQGYSKPLTPPQRPPNEVSGRIANLQKNVEPAFLSSREKAEEEKAKSGEEVDETPNEVVDEQTKPKKAFKPPPGAVQVMLPQFTAKQKRQADESD